ncbi:MAG: nucleotidyltransferase domain-containing protein [Cellulomonadaceae bacterium]|jgi:predicted nucleotidyltransferase|nr:nucleotidyltransferase domain-containing protein [Cellulomonadaceae bacterium]
MEKQLLDKREAVGYLCQKYGVTKMQAFGSAVTGGFDPDTSDYDFLVFWRSDVERPSKAHLGLWEELKELFGRDVDLVNDSAIRNPFFAKAARSEAVPYYG